MVETREKKATDLTGRMRQKKPKRYMGVKEKRPSKSAQSLCGPTDAVMN